MFFLSTALALKLRRCAATVFKTQTAEVSEATRGGASNFIGD